MAGIDALEILKTDILEADALTFATALAGARSMISTAVANAEPGPEIDVSKQEALEACNEFVEAMKQNQDDPNSPAIEFARGRAADAVERLIVVVAKAGHGGTAKALHG